jgi:iron-sulfur cluster repair protein YtfE (RIC family)
MMLTTPNLDRSMQPITMSSTVNDVLRDYPATGAIFNAYGVDTCCRADLPLRDAAAEAAVDADILLAMLEAHAQPDMGASMGDGR